MPVYDPISDRYFADQASASVSFALLNGTMQPRSNAELLQGKVGGAVGASFAPFTVSTSRAVAHASQPHTFQPGTYAQWDN